MSKSFFIALDQGTTSCRTLIFNTLGTKVAVAQKEFQQIYPKPGYVEHDPLVIWNTQLETLLEAITKVPEQNPVFEAIGITNQRETVVLWDKNTGVPIYNAIVWQDRRTANICEQLKNDGLKSYIQEQTGLVPDAYFSGTKIKWLLDNVPGARDKASKGDLLVGTMDTWLIWKLTNGAVHATDYTNASRTLVFNIRSKTWDKTLLEALQIPENILPKVLDSASDYGHAKVSGYTIPIRGVAGDQQAALYGQGCYTEGSAKNTYGTGCFMLVYTGQLQLQSQYGLLSTLACSAQGTPAYALEGSVFIAGALIQWLRDGLQLIKSASEIESLANSVTDSGGVTMVPAFVGLGAPYWDMHARGTLFGITRDTAKGHIARAALEAICFQNKDLLLAVVSDLNRVIPELWVDGGACRNNLLMQLQADILGINIQRPLEIESTAFGAAKLAMVGVGMSVTELPNTVEKQFIPVSDTGYFNQKYQYWTKAIERTKNWL